MARGEPRQVGRARCRGAGEEAPPQGWAAWTGPGPAGVRACVCVRACVSLSPCTQAGPPRLSAFPSWPVGDTPVTSCGLRGRGPLRPPPLPLPPAPGCLCVSDGFWFAGHYEGGEGLPGEAVVSALGQKEAEMDS